MSEAWEKRLAQLERAASAEAPHTAEYIKMLLQHNGQEEPDWDWIFATFLQTEPPGAACRAVGIRAYKESPDGPGELPTIRVRLILNCYPDGKFDDPNGGYMLTSTIKRRLHAMLPPSWRANLSVATEDEWRAIEARKDFHDHAQIKVGKP